MLASMFSSICIAPFAHCKEPDCTGELQYHIPPDGVSYETNPTIFGRILDGTEPSCNIDETSNTLTFNDRSPRAPLHALVIPKKYIKSVYELDPEHDKGLIEEMTQIALKTIQTEHPESFAENDYILCFHVPPFTSVDHLHLHVLAPASDMKWRYRYIKYLEGSRWCTSANVVSDLLLEGKYFI